MAAVLDREAVWTPGAEQWYVVAPGRRVFRHTFVAVGAGGLLQPMEDAAGLEYVGVAGQAVFAGGSARCPVLQRGEGRFLYHGTATQDALGLVAWAVGDETVSADRGDTTQGYAVGRISRLEPDGLVRVNITGFASTNVALFLAGWRRRFSIGPHQLTLDIGVSYRVGVTLPHSFSEQTYCAELVCDDAAVGAKVVISRNTAQKAPGYAEWTVYAPSDTPGAYYGSVTFNVTAYFAGEGWTGSTSGVTGTWDGPTEIL
jgi:hypothetical protein